MKARVYRNLNKGGLSIKTKDPISKKWKVTDYSNTVIMENCTFRTSEKEQQRIANGGHRSVHAWCEGDLISTDADDFAKSTAPVPYYSPYKESSFFINDKRVICAPVVKIFSPNKEGKS